MMVWITTLNKHLNKQTKGKFDLGAYVKKQAAWQDFKMCHPAGEHVCVCVCMCWFMAKNIKNDWIS